MSSSSSSSAQKRKLSFSSSCDEYGLATDPSKRLAQANEKEFKEIKNRASVVVANNNDKKYVGDVRMFVTLSFNRLQSGITDVVFAYIGSGDLAYWMITKALDIPPFLQKLRDDDYDLRGHDEYGRLRLALPDRGLALSTLFDPAMPITLHSDNEKWFLCFICECIRTGCEDAAAAMIAALPKDTNINVNAQEMVDSAFEQALANGFYSGCRFAMTTPVLSAAANTDLDHYMRTRSHRGWSDETVREKLLRPELHCRSCPAEGCRPTQARSLEHSSLPGGWIFSKPVGNKDVKCTCRCHMQKCLYDTNALMDAIRYGSGQKHFECLFRAGYMPSYHNWSLANTYDVGSFFEAARECHISPTPDEQAKIQEEDKDIQEYTGTSPGLYRRLVKTGFIKADLPPS